MELLKGSKKYVCPKCGKKRFVPFVDADGAIMQDGNGTMYGRCDRETSCGFFYKPANFAPAIKVAQPQEENKATPICFDNSVLGGQFCVQNPLLQYLVVTFGNADLIIKTLKEYNVTLSTDFVIWWQVTAANAVRTGKVMWYDFTGHRRKDMPPTWAHKVPELKKYITGGDELRQCLFGEHLLQRYPDKEVAVVESEKTAIIMTIVESRYLWLACGGSQMLKDEQRLQCLRGRHVTLYPDNGQYYNWLPTARKHNFGIVCEMEDGYFDGGKDIADLFSDICNK